MEAPQQLASRAPWWSERRPAPVAALAGSHAAVEVTAEPRPWSVILWVGGLCWLVVTGTALLWMLPASGTTMSGMYVITTQARAVQHLLVFLAAAIGYRIAIALGWPEPLWLRARVALINTMLALAVVSFSQIALALAAGFVDQHTLDMHETLDSWAPFSPRWESWAMPLRFFLPPYVLGLCAIALVLVAHRHHREALRAADLASAYAAARMAMLSAQLQPHFLFNSLHAISVLIDDSPRQAATMLARLGDFLRHALESSHWPWVDVATELAGLEAYLAVQQTRFSDRLSIAIDAAPESLSACVPSLLLQPLAENAVEHGRNEGGPALQVRVAASLKGERLRIAVSNSSPRLAAQLLPSDYGHGLSNVDLRLRAAYGSDARLTVGPDEHGGTSAVLDLPLRHVEDGCSSGQEPG
jgi:Histidine kinase